MAIIDNKITDGDISTYGVISAPDRLTGTANENKQVFDRLIKQAVKVKMNELIDDLLAASAAGQLGASPPSGLSGSTVQAVLQSLKSYVDSTKVAKEPGKGLSQNDYTDADKALVGQIPDKADKTYVDQNMVAQIPGKGLSSNDYTDAEKELVAQIPYKAGTDNVLTKDNTAPFEPTGEYNPCTKKYADDLAFSAGAVTSVFGRAGAVVAQDGDYTPKQVGAEPAFSVLPQSKGGTGQTSLQAARNAMGLGNTLGVLPVANGGTGQSSLANVTVGKATRADTAASSSKLTTKRTIALSGGATGTATGFDGSANITIPVTAINPANVSAGTLQAGVKATNSTDYTTSRLRNIRANTADLTPGSSALSSGEIYLVYE